jgi:hypothetical protein
MITEPKRIRVSPDPEIARLLEEAKHSPLILESNGEVYHLYREHTEELWKEYDARKVQSVIEEVAGSWGDLDTEKMIGELYSARERGTRPLSRP